MTKNDPRKALGKGLHALLPTRNTAPTATVPEPAPTVQNAVLTVSIQHVAPNPDQPRRDFEPAKLLELTRSIEQDGIIQPIIVRKSGPTDFQIIAGERRWRAAKAAGLTEVPVIVKTADDQQALELALVENIQREDLNPIELAAAFYRMASELGMSHDQIGTKTGKERTTITNAVRLLQLPTNIQSMVATKQLSAGHARALLKFEDEATQLHIATRCVAEGWSVRQIEDFTRKPASERKAKTKPLDAPLDPNVKFAVSELERVLGTRVRIVERNGGAGKIEIDYYSADDLSRVYDQIVGDTN
jgi:ParB family transcriptional regulator, chromosome partitioning protein